jgi:hypothetical protein
MPRISSSCNQPLTAESFLIVAQLVKKFLDFMESPNISLPSSQSPPSDPYLRHFSSFIHLLKFHKILTRLIQPVDVEIIIQSFSSHLLMLILSKVHAGLFLGLFFDSEDGSNRYLHKTEFLLLI